MDKYGIQLELLKEIDSLCRENGLKYVLYKDIARIAAENRLDRYNNIVLNIVMTRGEALKLRQLIYEQARADRFIESIEDSENYLRWSIIYGNVNTTDFNLVRTKNQANKGIHINIDFIEKVQSKSNAVKTLAYSELRRFTCISKDEWSLWYAQAAVKLTPILGKERIRKKYISVRSDNDIEKWDDIKNYKMVSINNNIINADIFEDIKDIKVNGIDLMAPAKIEKYLNKTKARRIDEINKTKVPNQRITSTLIGYKEVLDDPNVISIIKEANRNYEIIVDKKKKNKKAQNKINELMELIIQIVNDTKQ